MGHLAWVRWRESRGVGDAAWVTWHGSAQEMVLKQKRGALNTLPEEDKEELLAFAEARG